MTYTIDIHPSFLSGGVLKHTNRETGSTNEHAQCMDAPKFHFASPKQDNCSFSCKVCNTVYLLTAANCCFDWLWTLLLDLAKNL